MFRHNCVILRELAFITLLSYISTIADLIKINKIFKNIKFVQCDKIVTILMKSSWWQYIQSVC